MPNLSDLQATQSGVSNYNNALQNKILNGNFDLWQRGTSFTNAANLTYGTDRFVFEKSGAQTVNITRSTDVPTVTQSGFNSAFSWLLTVSSAAAASSSGYTFLSQKIEGFDYQNLHGQAVRLQFWVKASIAGTYTVAFRNGANNRSYVVPYSVNLSNTWEKKTVNVTLDTTGTWNFDNTSGLSVGWAMAAGTSFQGTTGSWQASNIFGASGAVDLSATNGATFQLAQVALYPSQPVLDVPFQRCGRSIQEEIAMCQRYYEKSYDPTVNPGTGSIYSGMTYIHFTTMATGNYFGSARFVTPKRSTPTVTIYTPGTGATGQCENMSNNVAAGASSCNATFLGAAGFGVIQSSGGTISAAAGFAFQFAADAEL